MITTELSGYIVITCKIWGSYFPFLVAKAWSQIIQTHQALVIQNTKDSVWKKLSTLCCVFFLLFFFQLTCTALVYTKEKTDEKNSSDKS